MWFNADNNDLKGGKEEKMAKIDDEFENMEDVEEEEEEEEIRKPKVTIKPKSQPQPTSKSRYVAVHQPQLDGAFDTQTNKAVATDIWDMLVLMYNKLENIERAVGS